MLKPNSTITANLIKARELIADEKNWWQGSWHNEEGTRHCAAGALYEVQPDCVSAMDTHLYLAAAAAHFGSLVAEINDREGHAAVIRLYDKAIELSLQEG